MGKFVYLIKSEDDSVYKIGVASDPKKRLKSLQTGNQSKIILINVFYSEFPYKIEKALHSYYSHLKETGEWFRLSLEHEIDFLTKCNKFEYNMTIINKNILDDLFLV